MCGEEVRDYFPFCAGKFVSLGHGRILRLKSENSTENQAARDSGEVSKVFIQNLTRYLDDGAVPIDNNQVENQIRPWALGRSNWLFAGSLRSGKRAAAIMSLIQSARMSGHDPYAYLKDVLTRLPTQRASEIGQLLPHQWVPALLTQGEFAGRLRLMFCVTP